MEPARPAAEQAVDRGAAVAGLCAVALFVIGSALTAGRPAFDAGAAELASYVAEHRTRLQLGTAALAAAVPPLIWFLATPLARTSRADDPGLRRLALAALACGTAFLTLFLADVTTIAVSALRPERLVADPGQVVLLRDLEYLAMGTAAFAASATLACLGVLALRDGATWPRWVAGLAIAAAGLYLLRAGTLFTTDGAFAADGALGLYVPVGALVGWVLAACAADLLRSRPSPAAARRARSAPRSR